MGFIIPLIGFIALFFLIYALIDVYPKIKLDIPSAPSVLPIIGHLHKVIGLDTERKYLMTCYVNFFPLISSN